jgi:hypothetical protein
VRHIRASVRRSRTWLRTAAPAATRAVPVRVASSAAKAIGPEEAVTKPTMVVNTTMVVIRGFVSSIQSEAAVRPTASADAFMAKPVV